MKLGTDVAPVDALMGGGVESGTFTMFYGEGGTGKTTLCLHLCLQCVNAGGKVAFVDTEGVSMERFQQLAGDRGDQVARDMLFFEAYDMKQQTEAVNKVIHLCQAEKRIRLVVLDSLTVFYRLALGTGEESAFRSRLSSQVVKLLSTARQLDLVVVGTTQVYRDGNTCQVRPIGGHMLMHNAKAVFAIERHESGERELVVTKHRSLKEGDSIRFVLGPTGIEVLNKTG